MSEKTLVESLAMDLLRASLGLRRGSLKTAERFKNEALKRQDEIEAKTSIDPYLKNLLKKSRKALLSEKKDIDEDLLMYSVLFQNFAQRHY